MRPRLPPWLKVKLGSTKNYGKIKKLLSQGCLHTICEEAACPNRGECWDSGTATFLILGDTCTRNCKYCNVNHGTPKELDEEEPKKLAETVKKLNLKYAVITSVTRDDLDDGGASVFVECVAEIRKLTPNCRIEILIPDFRFNENSLNLVINSKPFVINHNIEVVELLFSEIRPEGNYKESLKLLKKIKQLNKEQLTKSGFMIGLGETDENIKKTLNDLKEHDVDIITIGQYLQPSLKNAEVKKYYTPEEFKEFKKYALSLGFKHVESAPLVRSSYHAGNTVK
ncbi:lipoyl synthase [Candidatus Woesearchaeota archaeon]|nr:lipoyl synthase [Candidatus Woesearchaeota archaeon]